MYNIELTEDDLIALKYLCDEQLHSIARIGQCEKCENCKTRPSASPIGLNVMLGSLIDKCHKASIGNALVKAVEGNNDF